MATEQKKILIRRGNKADLVVADLQPGEPCFALDTNEVGIKTSGGAVLWFATLTLGPNAAVLASEKGVKGGVPTLDANQKVVEDPASYGKADGGVVLPHTLPTTAKIVRLLGGVLVPTDLPTEGTLLEVGPNNTPVAASASARLIDATSHDENGGYSHANVYRVGEMCFLSGNVGGIGSSSTPSGSVIMKLPTGFWPQLNCSIFPAFGTITIRFFVFTR